MCQWWIISNVQSWAWSELCGIKPSQLMLWSDPSLNTFLRFHYVKLNNTHPHGAGGTRHLLLIEKNTLLNIDFIKLFCFQLITENSCGQTILKMNLLKRYPALWIKSTAAILVYWWTPAKHIQIIVSSLINPVNFLTSSLLSLLEMLKILDACFFNSWMKPNVNNVKKKPQKNRN